MKYIIQISRQQIEFSAFKIMYIIYCDTKRVHTVNSISVQNNKCVINNSGAFISNVTLRVFKYCLMNIRVDIRYFE